MGNKYAKGRTEELKEGNGLCSLFLYPHYDLRTPKDVRGRPMKVPGLLLGYFSSSLPLHLHSDTVLLGRGGAQRPAWTIVNCHWQMF